MLYLISITVRYMKYFKLLNKFCSVYKVIMVSIISTLRIATFHNCFFNIFTFGFLLTFFNTFLKILNKGK